MKWLFALSTVGVLPTAVTGRVNTESGKQGGASSTGPADAILARIRYGQLDEASAVAGDVLAAEQPNERSSVALATFALAAFRHGDLTDAMALIRAAAPRAATGREPPSCVHPRLVLATVLIALGDLGDAEVVLRDAQATGERSHDLCLPSVEYLTARLHLATGRLGEASTAAANGLALCDRTAVPSPKAPFHWVRAVVSIRQGDLASAANHIERYQADPVSRCDGVDTCTYSLTAGILVGLQDGLSAANQSLSPLFADLPVLRQSLVAESSAAPFMVRAAMTAGDQGRAAAVVREADLLAQDNPGFVVLAAAALHAGGLFRQDAGLLRQAAALHRHAWSRASALEDAAGVLGESDVRAAKETLQAAVIAYTAASALLDGTRVKLRLTRLDAPAARPGRVRPVEGRDSLTDCERRVAELVSEGLTNREVARRLFVSRHTVDFHLRSIYRKLNIHSRVRVARVLNGLEPPDE